MRVLEIVVAGRQLLWQCTMQQLTNQGDPLKTWADFKSPNDMAFPKLLYLSHFKYATPVPPYSTTRAYMARGRRQSAMQIRWPAGHVLAPTRSSRKVKNGRDGRDGRQPKEPADQRCDLRDIVANAIPIWLYVHALELGEGTTERSAYKFKALTYTGTEGRMRLKSVFFHPQYVPKLDITMRAAF